MDARESTYEMIQPHGGVLVDLYLYDEDADAEREKARDLKSWDLTPRQVCDIEMLLNGAFSPLTGFLGKGDYESVVKTMRLADGTLWPTSASPLPTRSPLGRKSLCGTRKAC